ncbi:MAG: hypothetical protein FWD01_01420, partial [Defluviitaleaceae bacterium]|nr:hypothetical protein [Defluviitaleaceae bacterium]
LRTKSGGFCIEDAISIEKLEELSKKGMLTEAITPIDTVLKNFAKIAVHADADKFLKNGNPVKWDFAVCEKKEVKIGEQLLVYDYVGKLVGIHELCKIDGKCMLKPRVMF